MLSQLTRSPLLKEHEYDVLPLLDPYSQIVWHPLCTLAQLHAQTPRVRSPLLLPWP